MIHTARQLKDLVRNKSNSDSKKAQNLIRIYCMERFLERLSLSKYRDNFILKGGVLVSSMIGIDKRATRDIDTTIKGRNLTVEEATRMITEIADMTLDDGVRFELTGSQQIMEDSEYEGVRLFLNAYLETMKTPFKIDISTGDAITPGEIIYSYKLMFEDREIELLSYNLPTILAEKIETVISRGTANTRLRDFYDIYILSELYSEEIDYPILNAALDATSRKRGSEKVMAESELIIRELLEDGSMRAQWLGYQKKNEYADGISWNEVIGRLSEITAKLKMTVKE